MSDGRANALPCPPLATPMGVSAAVAYHHFIEQLSICLWRHNSHMFLHLFSLLPVSPLWELSPGVGSSAHGFCHSEPWACDT